MNDFGVALHAFNMARIKSVTVLNEMYVSMAEAGPVQDQTDLCGTRSQRTPSTPQYQQTPPGPDSSFTSPVAGFIWNGRDARRTQNVANSAVDEFGPPLVSPTLSASRPQPNYPPVATGKSSSHSHTSSGTTSNTFDSEGAAFVGSPPVTKQDFDNTLSSLKLHSDPVEVPYKKSTLNFPRPNSVASDARSVYAPSSSASMISQTISHPTMTSNPNPHANNNVDDHIPLYVSPPAASPDDRSLYTSSSGTPHVSGISPDMNPQTTNLYKTQSTDGNGNKIPFRSSPDPQTRKRLNNKPRSKRAASQESPETPSRPSVITSKSSSRKFSLFGGSKAPKEDYAGFCKGAHLMQVGEEGMKLRNQSVSFTGQNIYWTCSNSMCCFEGPAVSTKDVNKKTHFGYDEDIRDAYGVNYRWSFLAKSHTMIGNSKAGYEYQCAFCAGQGAPPFRVKGDKRFLYHVATHQGQTPNELKMCLIEYIIGREASNWEHFDINLPAPTAMLLETIEQPAELEAVEQVLPEMEAPLLITKRGSRPQAASYGNANESHHSGLGIRMSTGTISGIVQEYGSKNKISMQSPGIERPEQPINGDDWQDDSSHHPLLNGISDDPEANGNDTEVTRDSVHSLHPAPLFAGRPSIESTDKEREQDQQQQQQHWQQEQQQLQHHHHQNHHRQAHQQAQKPLPEPPQRRSDGYLDTYPYDNSADAVDPELRGSFSLADPRQTTYITMDGRQVSMWVPEDTHSTPDPAHPGTQWMA